MEKTEEQEQAREAWIDRGYLQETDDDGYGYGYMCGTEQFQSRLLEEVDKRIAEREGIGWSEHAQGQNFEAKEIRNLITTLKP
jgi:hypothetical protein